MENYKKFCFAEIGLKNQASWENNSVAHFRFLETFWKSEKFCRYKHDLNRVKFCFMFDVVA
jgi:hypothetical protein